MYHNNVDQHIVYSAEDLVLFRESPFACWMERLTLENPSHGIPVDVQPHSFDAGEVVENALAQSLRLEGKDVIVIDSDTDESMRRTATLAAMRHGVNYIVNGQLAVGPLSDSAELLMRTPGFSELGNYLYIPCETEVSTVQNSAFRLCFLADLLHSLQGQLPPQVLVLRDDSDVLPLRSEDYIFHYRAVKQRFMASQNAFRKHRMPDPVESGHFGRWSDCANELLKQRALGQASKHDFEYEQEHEVEQEQEEIKQQEQVAQPLSAVAVGASSQYDLDTNAPRAGTLVEQARMLEPEARPDIVREPSVDSLQNLEFIGSSQYPPSIGESSSSNSTADEARTFGEAPPASLRNPANVDLDVLQDENSSKGRSSLTPFSNRLMTNYESSD